MGRGELSLTAGLRCVPALVEARHLGRDGEAFVQGRDAREETVNAPQESQSVADESA